MTSDETTELIELLRSGMAPEGGAMLEGDEMMDGLESMLRESAHPQFEMVMVDNQGREAVFPGVEGFREGMTEWLSPYESYRAEIEEVIPLDDSLIIMVRQVGRTRHGGVEVDNLGGTVWKVRDGQIIRAEFHLDRRSALRSVGLEE